MRWIRSVLISVLLLGACTQPSVDQSPPPSVSARSSGSPSVVAAGARLPDGTPLPDGCSGSPDRSQTTAFVAEGRAWALDPASGGLSCLFEVTDPGLFTFGPQGDRVLLDSLEVRGLDSDAPDLPAIDAQATAFDWGHPIGLAVVFAGEGPGRPVKRYTDDGRVEKLASLPPGEYLQIAYHPSGLALAFVREGERKQSIWISTNEGEDPQRLVFSEVGTKFTSIAFSPDGTQLWWSAEHIEGYPELHRMDLATRDGFGTTWTGPIGLYADELRIAPRGPLQSVNEGRRCDERQAFVVKDDRARPAMPSEERPNEAVGWLDRRTLLVAVGGCDEPLDLYAVDGLGKEDPAALVLRVDEAAVRTRAVNPPTEVPQPAADEELPPGGFG